MKIVFLTSCLEPGKDGVGDYTRMLAEECARHGHTCRLGALNDRHLTASEAATDGAVPAVRFGLALPWPERIAKARQFITNFGPDQFSLQFVCYGFHPKGIHPPLAGWLKSLVNGAPVQIMFHELWIGAEVGARWKDKLVGAVQRHFVLDLVRKLGPAAVHTSNPAYVSLLEANHIAARQLPLFGAIPVRSNRDDEWLAGQLRDTGINLSATNRANTWLLGFFGTLHPVWPPEPLFSHLRDASQKLGKRIVIGAIGRLGAGMRLWESLVRDYSRAFQFCHLGEQPVEKVSAFLSRLDFGIAATPYALIGKSATAAAMLEFGLPIIVNRDEVHFKSQRANGQSGSPLLIRMNQDLPRRLAEAKRQPARSILPDVTRQFLADLKLGK